MKKLFSLLIALALLGTGVSALALSANQARHIPPRQVIGKVAEHGRGTMEWYSRSDRRGTASIQSVAQTFTAPVFKNSSLSGVALQIARGRNAIGRGTDHAAVTVTLYANEDPQKGSSKDRLFRKTTRLPGRLRAGEYLVFDFEKSFRLKKGKRYSVTFVFDMPRPGQSLSLAAGSQQSYTAGRAYIHNNLRHKSPRWESTRENLSLVLLGQ